MQYAAVASDEQRQDAPTVSLERKPGESRPVPVGRLRVVHPADTVVSIPLAAATVVVGRKPDAATTPPLIHKTVSRRHFAVDWDGRKQRHVGRDLDSRNGSWIDGVVASTEPVPLGHGSVVRLGDVLAVYESGPGLGADEAPAVSRKAVPGECAPVRQLRADIARAAADPSPVLIIGETGTGKELIAAELHRLSGRTGAFVPVNAAALSAQLIESQLFGHVKGAFTGATSDSEGMFRAADGGSLFLDEIGELPLALQPKLLRAIQEGQVSPLGSARNLDVDVRIVAATNRELATAADAGEFRRDLYARLAMWQLRAPPLRERRADLFTWIDVLFEQWCAARDTSGEPLRFDANAAEALLLQSWPENLRGLDRLVHELASTRPTESIGFDELPGWLDRAAREPGPATPAGEATPRGGNPRLPAPETKQQLVDVLEANDWSVRATAKHYGRERRQVYRWMDKFGIERKG